MCVHTQHCWTPSKVAYPDYGCTRGTDGINWSWERLVSLRQCPLRGDCPIFCQFPLEGGMERKAGENISVDVARPRADRLGFVLTMSNDDLTAPDGTDGNRWEAQALESIDAEMRQLTAERDRIDARLKALARFRAQLIPLAGLAPQGTGEDSVAGQGVAEPPGNMSRRIREATRRFLQECGAPMGRKEILRRLAADGVVVTGADAGRTVSKVLWRSRDFVHVGDGYWLAQPEPEGPRGSRERDGRGNNPSRR